MPDDCPCTPVATFIAETEGRFNLIEEKFSNSSEQVQRMAMELKESAAQIDMSVRTVLKMQSSIEQQNERLKAGQERFTTQAEDIETLEECMRKIPDHIRDAFVYHKTEVHTPLRTWLKKLTYGAAVLVAFVLITHGDDAWALIKLLL